MVYYENNYGFVPFFKAGVHLGEVTVSEVGIIKREIAYHGDTINTASRIQAQCNKYGKRLLISGQLYQRLGKSKDYKIVHTDSAILKGKNKPVCSY